MASQHRHLTAGRHLLLFLLVTTSYSSAQSSNNKNNNNNQYFPNTNFNPTMAIVIIVLISVFFFLGFFSMYIRQCAGDRLNPRLSSSSTAFAARSRRQCGLDPELLQTFPTLVYSEVKGLQIGKGSLECAVCLSEFEGDETLRLLPKCSHVFHPDCIDAWLAAHVTCPICRCNLNGSDEKTKAEAHHALTTETSPEQLELPTDPPAAAAAAEDEQEMTASIIRIDEDNDESCRSKMNNLERFVNLKRARSQARPVNFPRSHSTGHSLVQPGQNLDRFTLRLPEDIRKEIVAANLQRTTSCVAFRREASTRRVYIYREGSLGSDGRSIRLGWSDRWGSFLSRTLSLKNWGTTGSVKGVMFNGVMGPLGGKSGAEGKEEVEECSTASLNEV